MIVVVSHSKKSPLKACIHSVRHFTRLECPIEGSRMKRSDWKLWSLNWMKRDWGAYVEDKWALIEGWRALIEDWWAQIEGWWALNEGW